MLSQIDALKAKLESMIDKASRLSESDNEDTANKYAGVLDALNSAMDSLQDARDEMLN